MPQVRVGEARSSISSMARPPIPNSLACWKKSSPRCRTRSKSSSGGMFPKPSTNWPPCKRIARPTKPTTARRFSCCSLDCSVSACCESREDDFSFGRGSDEPAAPKPDKQFADLLTEGPPLGLHTIIWSDTPITLEPHCSTAARCAQFDNRILFQMSRLEDSSNLIDSPISQPISVPTARLLLQRRTGNFRKVPGRISFRMMNG